MGRVRLLTGRSLDSEEEVGLPRPNRWELGPLVPQCAGVIFSNKMAEAWLPVTFAPVLPPWHLDKGHFILYQDRCLVPTNFHF